jgi:endonuclease-3
MANGRTKRPSVAKPGPVTPRTVGGLMAALRRQAPSWNAPIVTLVASHTRDPFHTLISCILSLRTKDQTTAVATRRLFEKAATPDEILALPVRTLERLIFPVGFYRTKARVIRGICEDLKTKFDGQVPDDLDALLTLKGVGRKTANLVITEAFRKPGICVDTHVHRISNRWGLVRTTTPDKTEMALRQVLPRRHWLEFNPILVAFGQTLCHPTSPWCSRCPVEERCPRIGVERSR